MAQAEGAEELAGPGRGTVTALVVAGSRTRKKGGERVRVDLGRIDLFGHLFHDPIAFRQERLQKFRGTRTDRLGRISDGANSAVAVSAIRSRRQV